MQGLRERLAATVSRNERETITLILPDRHPTLQRLIVRQLNVNTTKTATAMQVKSAWKEAMPVNVKERSAPPLTVGKIKDRKAEIRGITIPDFCVFAGIERDIRGKGFWTELRRGSLVDGKLLSRYNQIYCDERKAIAWKQVRDQEKKKNSQKKEQEQRQNRSKEKKENNILHNQPDIISTDLYLETAVRPSCADSLVRGWHFALLLWYASSFILHF